MCCSTNWSPKVPSRHRRRTTPLLRVPRDELRHAFVLKPLADIAPDARHPVSRDSIAALWAAHRDHGVAFERVELG